MVELEFVNVVLAEFVSGCSTFLQIKGPGVSIFSKKNQRNVGICPSHENVRRFHINYVAGIWNINGDENELFGFADLLFR